METVSYKKIFVLDLLPFVKEDAGTENDEAQNKTQALLLQVYTSLPFPEIIVPMLEPKKHNSILEIVNYMNINPYSASLLRLGGFLHLGMGGYFIFLRPSLLPEDNKYIGSPLPTVQNNIPGLAHWLQKVFWVLGGFAFTTGLFKIYIAQTSFRERTNRASLMIKIAGIPSIGFMTVVNVIIHSYFRWVFLAFALTWIVSLILFKIHK